MKSIIKLIAVGLLSSASIAVANDSPQTNRTEFNVTQLNFPGGAVSTVIDVPPGHKAIMTTASYAKLASEGIEPAETTEKQAVVLLKRIESRFKEEGHQLKNVVQVRAFLVPDPDNDYLPDYKGWNQAYKKFFGTDKNPSRPIRTTVIVDSLPTEGALVRVEVISVTKINPTTMANRLKK